MQIVTLTTDWGLKDFYVGAFKGAILSSCPDVTIIDITNEIPVFDILKASFVLKNSYNNFPKGTIHVVDVNKWNNRNREIFHIAVKFNDHYFIGRDNGLFSLVFDTKPQDVFEIPAVVDDRQYSLNIREVYVKAISELFKNKNIEKIGKKNDNWFEMKNIQPIINENSLLGTVIYIDSYDNVITNITRKLFNEVANGRKYKIFFKRQGYYDIEKISKSYHDVEIGERLAIFNSSDFLEIALNEGKAASLIGLTYNETVRVEFYNE